jgi:hypothetical protein
MTPHQKVDIVTFVLIAVACVWDLFRAGRYPSNVAREVRLKAVGILLWVSVLPAGVFLKGSSSLGAWFALMALLAAGGAFFFYWLPRRD